MTQTLKPQEGGCWFCHTGEQEGKELIFSTEFDTNLHKSCLEGELNRDASNPEARIMGREFDIALPPDPLDRFEF